MKGHLKHMLIGGGAILVVLLLVGVSVRDALPWAVLLACPLMMVGMMFMMSRGMGAKGGAAHQHGPHCATDETKDVPRADQNAWVPPAQEGRVAR
ncbi:DUF2933 domain-containing protein [Actinotalea subterranea]|uniref:DUF2933 domain-containing protein n=1 Tax=Actinotalea subterranea TaxID=2607497 RepID=UPI0011EF4008|nr:DUF2933 domain-containing protein [Actinotalea subterranea]